MLISSLSALPQQHRRQIQAAIQEKQLEIVALANGVVDDALLHLQGQDPRGGGYGNHHDDGNLKVRIPGPDPGVQAAFGDRQFFGLGILVVVHDPPLLLAVEGSAYSVSRDSLYSNQSGILAQIRFVGHRKVAEIPETLRKAPEEPRHPGFAIRARSVYSLAPDHAVPESVRRPWAPWPAGAFPRDSRHQAIRRIGTAP